jgi:2,4-dienoyl-CoA reductase-like NADH-dependent reductase (Old Yellow Enzyme family)
MMLGDPNRTPGRNVEEEGYYQTQAQQLKQKVRTPIILTGGIKSYEVAADIIQNNVADYIGLCRPLIREPNLVNRWKSGDTRKSGCISDNACLFRGPDKDLQCFHLKTG